MENETLYRLLEQRPGYAVVHLLMQSDQRRQDIADFTDSGGGTLERWLKDAEEAGLISSRLERTESGPIVIISLEASIPPILIEIIYARGGAGSRDNHSDHADTGNSSKWLGSYSLDNIE